MKHFWMAALSLLCVLALGASTNQVSESSPFIEGMSFYQVDSRSRTSAAVMVDDLPLFHTAQILPVDNAGQIIGGTNVEAQTIAVLNRLNGVLRTNFASLCKLNVYVAKPEAVATVRQVIASQLTPWQRPALTLVVGALPHAGALVAVDAVAPVAAMVAKLHEPRPIFDRNKGIRSVAILPAGPKIYVSGMADTNDLTEATTKTLEKLVGAIDHLYLEKRDIVQLKAFLQPMGRVESVRKAITNFFGGDAPPTVFVEWISPKPNPPIEIELIASARRGLNKETNSVTFLTPPGTTDSKVFRRVARVNYGRLIYISGLYGNSPDSGAQVNDIFDSLGPILKDTNTDFQHLVKATYYVSDDTASTRLNEIRPKFYNPQRAPAASKAKVPGVGEANKSIVMDMIAVTR